MENFGLVFKDGYKVVYGEYTDEGLIEHFHEITDGQGIYTTFPNSKFSLVVVTKSKLNDDEDVLMMRDVCSFEIVDKNKKPAVLSELPEQLLFDFAVDLYQESINILREEGYL